MQRRRWRTGDGSSGSSSGGECELKYDMFSQDQKNMPIL